MTRKMIAPAVAIVSLTAIRQGEKTMLLDANGRQFAVIDTMLARQVSQELRLSFVRAVPLEWHDKHHGWRAAYARMKSQYLNWRKRLHLSGWEKKAYIWAKSIRWRRNKNRTRPPRKTQFLRGARPRITEDWETACVSFRQRHAGMIIKKKKRIEDPWLLWAETVYSNHRKKRDIDEDRRQRISITGRVPKNPRTTGIQMCFEWSADRSEAVFA